MCAELQLTGAALNAQDGGDACRLLPMQHGDALLLLLMSEDWRPTAEALAALAAAVAAPLQRLTTAAAAEVAAAHDGHVKGFRYGNRTCVLIYVLSQGFPQGHITIALHVCCAPTS